MTNNLLITLAHSSSLNRFMMVSVVLGAASLPSVTQATEANTVQLPAVTVEADRANTEGYKVNRASSPKLSQPLRDTPQTVTVIPEEIIQERAATTLRDVLRNVTGVSIAAGEGGTPNGDNLTIRGFSARTDIFVDGIRDFGGYFRDPFNLEQVEVIKGPASAYSGRGSTGGSINLVTKAPKLEASKGGSLSLGTDQTKRVTADVNQPLTGLIDSAALRLNVMVHDSEVAGRDFVENQRWAIAPSLAFGLGTSTRTTFSYLHQDQDNIPDYGHPYVNGRPAQVDRENFYGLSGFDYEDTSVDMVTAKIEHDFNETLTVRNQLRYGNFVRDSIVTAPRLLSLPADTVNRTLKTRDSVDTILLDQVDLTAKFTTGTLGHTLVSGIEVGRETSENVARTASNGPVASLDNPNPYQTYAGTITRGATTETEADTLAAYTFDTLKLNAQWEIAGGLRYDRFDADFTSTAAAPLGTVDDMLSWKGAVTFKPLPAGSIYFAYGTSFNPSAEGLSLTTATASLDPEESRIFELGTKWDLLDKRVALSSALFRTEKTNARTPDPIGGVTVLEGEQVVDGIEFGVTGRITKQWQVFAGYSFMDSEITESGTAAEVGREVLNVPAHTFNLWTTYELPINVEIGGGTQYVGNRFSNNTNTNEVSGYWRFDAMASYHMTENIDIQLNVFNLADEYYYESIGGGHLVPGAGRSAMLTTSVRF